MGKTYGICDFRRGKVGKLVFRKVADKNIISEKPNYYPVNSAWLKKEEFKKYVLSLLDEGIPQIYVLKELPEELYPYALIFVQNEEQNTIYVDKEGIRTEIKIGDNNYDAVNVVENVPQNLNNNVIYYSENQIDEQVVLKNGLKLDKQKSYTYVYEDEKIKQVVPNVDYIAEEQMVFKNKTIKGEDNTIQNLIPEDSIKPGYIINKIEESKHYYGYISIEEPKEIVFLDIDGDYITSYVYKATLENNIITEIISKSDEKIYYDGDLFTYEGRDYERYNTVDQVFPILDKSITYSQAIKTYVDDKTQPINDLTTKSLKNIYNSILASNRVVATDDNGYLKSSTLKINDAISVVNGILDESLKNIYYTTLSADKVVSTDSSGCIEASSLSITNTTSVVNGILIGCLKNIYNKNLNNNRVIASGSNGYLEASSLNINNTVSVVNAMFNYCLQNIYNRTLDTNRVVSTDSSGNLEASSLNINNAISAVTGVLNKCLKNIYNKTLTAGQNVVTDVSGCLSTVARDHLYAHHFHYDHGGRGEVNFVIYHKSSTQLSNTALGDFLYNLGCSEYWKAYPANGQAQYTGGIVQGVYAVLNGGGLAKYTIYVASYTIGGNYQEDLGNYLDTYWEKIVQIF